MRHIIEMIWKMGIETEQNRSPIRAWPLGSWQGPYKSCQPNAISCGGCGDVGRNGETIGELKRLRLLTMCISLASQRGVTREIDKVQGEQRREEWDTRYRSEREYHYR